MKKLVFLIVTTLVTIGLTQTSTCTAAETNRVVTLSDTVSMELIYIAPGTFQMGSPTNEVGHILNEISHNVTLTRGYWMGKYEVTQEQWQALMETNPSRFKGTTLPVERVSWNDALKFCKTLTEQERKLGKIASGDQYTLPTEAQWEYACRAGTTSAFNDGSNLSQREDEKRKEPKIISNMDQLGWYGENSARTPHPVGEKQPNAWGLYDMHGNVYEWCLDSGNYESRMRGVVTGVYTNEVTNPRGTAIGSYRVIRGGGWRTPSEQCRSAYRSNFKPTSAYHSIGFRVVFIPSTEDSAQKTESQN